MAVRALRGATTVEQDTPAHITPRVQQLVEQLLARNDISHDDLISMVFTVTEDISSMFPAAAARAMGLGDVPLLCAREIPVQGSTPLCIRLLVHAESNRARSALHHVYLEGARGLRDDLPD
ncbi:MAG: chorismate mutase [Actinomycetota bacterium]|nr:chorismate mutase [Actinomycetota bacterium]